jgi:putative transposase
MRFHDDRRHMALTELTDKGADIDVLRQTVQFMAQRLMELDVEGRCGAGCDEKRPERLNSRNGSRGRLRETRTRSVLLKIRKLRQGNCCAELLEPRRTAEKMLTAVIQEAYVQGIAARSVGDLVMALGMSRVAKSQVGRLCAELDERVSAFLNRQIGGHRTYLWIDAACVKTREAGRAVSVSVRANSDGQREVRGPKVGASEADPG